MKLPWVSREAYDAAMAGKDAVIAVLHDDLAEARAENRALRTPTQTGVVGDPPAYVPKRGLPPLSPEAEAKALQVYEDEKRIRKAINENAAISGKIDPRLQSHLRGYAAELRRGGASTDEIEEKLGTWISSEPQEMAG